MSQRNFVSGLLALVMLVSLAESVFSQTRSLPNQNYYLSFTNFYQADYRSAIRDFERGGRTAYQMGTQRYLDSICYWTMTAECHYHTGNYAAAIQLYEQSLDLYLSYQSRGWQANVQMPPTIQADNAAWQRARVNWGTSTRQAIIPSMPSSFSVMFGDLNAEQKLQQGGVVQNAELRPIDITEIMRCTALAMHRRRVIKGPTCKYDPFSVKLVNGLRTAGGGNTMLGAYNGVLLGIAEASNDEWERAAKTLSRSLQFNGGMDHPLTPVALVELANIGLQTGNLSVAGQLALEASLSAGVFYQYDLVEEALTLGTQVHLLQNKNAYPPLEAAIVWAGRDNARMTQASLSIRLAENLAEAGSPELATKMLLSASNLVRPRNSLARTPMAARSSYVAAVVQFMSGDFANGKVELAKALAGFRTGSLWLYRLGLADQLVVSGNVSERQADLLYSTLLHDPTDAEWAFDPLECLTFLTTSHVGSLELWFDIVINRKDVNRALEIAEMVRRHRFYSNLPLGGRLMAFRWMMHAPEQALSKTALDQRRSFAARNVQYQQWSTRADEIRTELMALPISPEINSEEDRQQIKLLQELAAISSRQEAMLASFALRREPAKMEFPPQREFKSFQETMRADQMALVTMATGRGYHSFLVRKNAASYLGLARERDVVRGVGGMLKKLGLTDSAIDVATLQSEEWKELATELSASLLGGVTPKDWEPIRELVIVPDGVLWYMPFELLQVGEENAKKNLVDQVSLRYSPTLFLAYGAQRPQRRLARTAVVCAKMHPRVEPQMTTAAFAELLAEMPGAVKLDRQIRVPTNLLGATLDQLVVWSDLLQAKTAAPLAMVPMQLDQNPASGTLAAWFDLPWHGPEHVVLPGFNSDGGSSLRGKMNGSDLFLTTTGLMAAGSRTILISRWRTGGANSLALTRNYASRLPTLDVDVALAESRAAAKALDVNYENEPRLRAKKDDPVLKAEHPLFWAGMMLLAIPEQTQPDAILPPAAKPDAVDPDAVKPDAVEPNAAQPNAAQPNAAQPNAAVPDAAQPDAALPDAAQPDAEEPNAAKPDAEVLDGVKPEV